MSVLSDLAARLHDVWCEERCEVELRYEPKHYGNPPSWSVRMTWMDEYARDHGADFVTFDWLTYGDTAEEAMSGAVEWAEALYSWGEASA